MIRLVLLLLFVITTFVQAQSNIIVDEDSLIAKPATHTKKAPPKKIIKTKKNPLAKKKIKKKKNLTHKTVRDEDLKLDEEPKSKIKQKPSPVKSITRPTPTPAPPQPPSPKIEKTLSLEPSTDTATDKIITETPPTALKSHFKNRKALTIDYNTWYEVLRIKDKSTLNYGDSKSHYFGIGLYYDYTVYREKFGYAFTLGAIYGNAQAGTSNTGEYYQRRIPWYGFRTGGRVFVRANNRVDIGPSILLQYKTTPWPEETNFQVVPQANPESIFYLDTRWRISYPLELIQSFGFHTKQYALVWRLGINYTLN